MDNTVNIKSIKTSAMTNEENTRFHGDFSLLLNGRPTSVIGSFGITDHFGLHTISLTAQRSVLDIITNSKETSVIVAKDKERGKTITGFTGEVRALQNHFDPAKQEAAKRLYKACKHYGKIKLRRFNEKTEAIADILREFERPDLVAAIALLGLGEWITRLTAQNDEIIELTHQRYVEHAELPPLRMSVARKITDKAFRSIIQHLEHLVLLGKVTPPLVELIAEINALISTYKSSLAQKAGILNSKNSNESTNSKNSNDSNDSNNSTNSTPAES